MSAQVSVPVLYDGNGQFLDGSLLGVHKDAFVVGSVTRPRNPRNASAGTVSVLQVKDSTLGTLYLLMSRADFEVAVNAPKNGSIITALDENISTVTTADDALTDEIFSRPINEIVTNQQTYIINVDFTQNVGNKTVTWLGGGSFINNQVLIAK